MNENIIGRRVLNFLKEEILEITFDVIESQIKDKYKKVLDENVSKKLDAIIKTSQEILDKSNNQGIYKIRFKNGIGKLQESTKYPGCYLGNVIDPSSKKIIEVAKLEEIQQLPVTISSIYSIASVATQQYYLEEIDAKLSDISNNIEQIKSFMRDEKRSKLESYEYYFKQIAKSLVTIEENKMYKNAVGIEIQRIQNEIFSYIQLYKKQLDKNSLTASKDKKLEKVQIKIEEAKEYIASYKYATTLYVYCKFLETIIFKITDEVYINDLIQELNVLLEEQNLDYDKWKKEYNSYLENVVAYQDNKTLELIGDVGDAPILMAIPAMKHGLKVAGEVAKQINKTTKKTKEEKKQQNKNTIDEALIKNTEKIETIIKEIEIFYTIQNKPLEIIMNNGKAYINYAEETEQENE